jgi:hypothetical protein
MPIPALLIGAAQILFVIHAARTGRPYYWFFILLFIPMLGILAYIVVELLPGAGRSPATHKTMGAAKRLINPEGRYRALATNLEIAPTVANMRALADECVRCGRLDEAEQLYRDALRGLHATDPYLMLGLAKARFERGDPSGCLDTLAELKSANPDFQSADAHMLFARSLEAASRNEEALREYESLSRYYGGEEPRVRRGLLLRKLGDHQTALDQFAEVLRSVERSPSFYRRNQGEWYRLARLNSKP